MERRALLATLVGGYLAVPLIARAQQPGKVYRVGYLGLGAGRDGLAGLLMRAFHLVGEFRWADGDGLAHRA